MGKNSLFFPYEIHFGFSPDLAPLVRVCVSGAWTKDRCCSVFILNEYI